MGPHIATSILCFARSWLCPALLRYQTWDHSVLPSPPALSALWSLCGQKKAGKTQKQLFDLFLLGMALPLEQTQSSCPSLCPEGQKMPSVIFVCLAFLLVSEGNQKSALNQCVRNHFS